MKIGIVRYYQLSEEAKKKAYDHFAYNFEDDKPSGRSESENLALLDLHWFTDEGDWYLGSN